MKIIKRLLAVLAVCLPGGVPLIIAYFVMRKAYRWAKQEA